MSSIPEYEYDVFISYAHLDDSTPTLGTPGWVTKLSRLLDSGTLPILLGRKPKVFIDHQLSLGEEIGPALDRLLDKTAVLMPIISKAYLNSAWCKKERDHFFDVLARRQSAALRVPAIIGIELVPVPALPPPLARLKHQKFWLEHPDDPESIVLLTDDHVDPQYARCFSSAIETVSNHVMRHLEQFAKPQEPALGKVADAPGRRRVFVAFATDDLYETRTDLARNLLQIGVNLVDELAESLDPVVVHDSLAGTLDRDCLMVQILGPSPGRRGDEWPLGLPGLQYDFARKLGMDVIQWRSPTFDTTQIADQQYRALVEGPDVRSCPMEEFKTEVLKLAQAPRDDDTDEAPPMTLLVDACTRDIDVTGRIMNFLRDHNIISLNIAEVQGDQNSIESFKETVKLADGILYIAGNNANLPWLTHRYLKGIQYARGKALGLVDCREEGQMPLGAFPRLRYLDCRRRIDVPALTEFVQTLRN